MKYLYNYFLSFYKKHIWLSYVFIILFGLIFFGLMQANKTILDPDGFYHIRIATLMLKDGIVKEFPWLVFTDLSTFYTDHHFIYHIILSLFINFFEPIVGVKIATTFINTSFLFIFYSFLKNQKIQHIWLYIIILLSSSPFLFRINLTKASSLSLIILFLILFSIFKKKYKTLFALSFLYVWSYGGWPLSIIVSGTYFLSSFLSKKIQNNKGIFIIIKSSEWQPFIITILGSVIGIVINPYFPENILFYWLQIIQIAMVNYGSNVGVGMEWYGFSITQVLIYSSEIILLLLIGGLLFFGRIAIKKYKIISEKEITKLLFFLILSGFFFILTLKSKRNSEYFYPFVVIFAALFINYFWDKDVFIKIKNNIQSFFKKRFLYIIFILYIIFMFFFAFLLNFIRIKTDLESGHSINEYKEAMETAMQNSNYGDIIFHSDWDDWPILFYHNQYNRYIVGLDPTFLYKYNSDLYKKWRDITRGDFEGDPYYIIKNDFNAKVIFIANSDKKYMDKYIKDNKNYELLYEGDADVYKVK